MRVDSNRTPNIQFSLGKLILATNFLGLAPAVLVATNGFTFSIAVICGLLIGFAMPLFALLYLTFCWLCESHGWVRNSPLESTARKEKQRAQEEAIQRTPFDD